jgi:hypothetical protein
LLHHLLHRHVCCMKCLLTSRCCHCIQYPCLHSQCHCR